MHLVLQHRLIFPILSARNWVTGRLSGFPFSPQEISSGALNWPQTSQVLFSCANNCLHFSSTCCCTHCLLLLIQDKLRKRCYLYLYLSPQSFLISKEGFRCGRLFWDNWEVFGVAIQILSSPTIFFPEAYMLHVYYFDIIWRCLDKSKSLQRK